MKIVFMGTPDFAVPCLKALNLKYDVCLVVAQPDKEVGRKRVLTSPPVAQCAKELGLELFQPVRLKDDYQRIIDCKADMIVTAAYGQIVPDAVLQSVKRAINVHGSLLPKYRGGAPIQRSIMAGDKKTGISIIEMVSRLDAGRIFAKEEIEITDDDNSSTMFEKLSLLGCDLLMNTIEDIYNDKISGTPQNESEVIYSPNIKREEEHIDFSKTTDEIINMIRGLALEPGAYANINGEPFKIYKAEAYNYSGSEDCGTIIDLNKKIVVKTSDGAISLIDIKPSGKKMMKARDFLNGQKILSLGDKFE